MAPLAIELLYAPGCPTERTAPALLRSVLDELGLPGDFDSIPVHTEEEAHRLRFLGSPTLRVNSVDIDPSARDRTDFGLG